jgi:hypothetical protein
MYFLALKRSVRMAAVGLSLGGLVVSSCSTQKSTVMGVEHGGTGGASQRLDSGSEPGRAGRNDGSGGATAFDAEVGAVADTGANSPADANGGDVVSSDGVTPDAAVGPAVVQTIDVSDVWSGHPVAFSLLTRGDQQFAAFYDANRQMTIAARSLTSTSWHLVSLPTSVVWDSHNYVTTAIDAQGYLHVSGNMHGVPLIYFRTTAALNIDTFARVPSMVGANELLCTYPQFFLGPSGALVFAYRDGASGNGNYIFNTYDVNNRSWSRLTNALLDGQGLYSAYPVGPVLGPDGFYHLVWVWRDTPDAGTNHDLSYAKSQDLVNWQTAGGRALTLPITLSTGDIVDPVPAGGGMINNNTKIGFDAQNRPIVSYHKYDAAGATQLYNARFENGRWVPHQTSQWGYRWAFGGNGTLVFEIEVESAKLQANGDLTEEWYHAQYGGWGAFRLDPGTLAAAATIDPPLPYPKVLDTPESPTPGMVVRWASDAGSGPDPNVLYMLRWETLESNRDLPRDPIPPATRLRLYAIRQPR